MPFVEQAFSIKIKGSVVASSGQTLFGRPSPLRPWGTFSPAAWTIFLRDGGNGDRMLDSLAGRVSGL